jgi:hypothetical protein
MTPADTVAALVAGRSPEQVIAALGQPAPPPWDRDQLDKLAGLLRPDPAQHCQQPTLRRARPAAPTRSA